MIRRLVRFLVLALPLPLFSGSIILVTLDTTRADHLSLYGYAQDTSPNLKAFAAKGRTFSNADSAVPLTLPSHYSILSGHVPWEQGLWLNGQRVEPGEDYLPVRLKHAGWRTGAMVSSGILDRGFGLAKGFDVYDDAVPSGGGELPKRSCSDTTRAARDFMRGAQPFFLWVHYFEPHAPYVPPDPYRSRFGLPYDAEIAAMDACLGDLLADAGPDTLVVIAGDHGEMLGEHGEAEHGVLLYQGALHVPLVVRGPGVAPGISNAAVTLPDIYSTLAAFAGLPLSPEKDGRDLRSPSLASVAQKAASIYGREVYGFLPVRAVTEEGSKLLAYGDTDLRLFDLRNDTAEQNNIFGGEAKTSRRLKTVLKDIRVPDSLSVSMTQEQKKTLSSLGYLSPSPQPALLMPPEEGLKAEAVYREAKERWDSGDLAGAVEKGEAVLKANPRHSEAMSMLGKIALQRGRSREAVNWFTRIAAQRPADAVSHLRLGQALRAGGEPGKAESELRAALKLNPRLSDGYGELAILLYDRKDAAGLTALKAAADAQAIRSAILFLCLGQMEADRGSWESAFAEFHEAFILEPAASDPLRGLAFVSLKQGKKTQALTYYRQLLRLEPSDPEANFAAGSLVYETGGNKAEALRHLQTALRACSGALCDAIRNQIKRVEAGNP